MLDPSSSFARFARPARLVPNPTAVMWITCIACALTICWPINALAAEDPNQAVTTGIPIVDAILKVLGAVYAICSLILLILPKASKFAEVIATVALDSKGVIREAAAVKEAKTGAMAERIRRESSMPPPRDSVPPTMPRGFARVPILVGLSAVALAAVAIGLLGCKTNAARAACDIVHIVDNGCDVFVQVPLPDGTVEKVPRSEIVRLARETKAARLSGGGAPDGGAP
jgi:hypothetical protein